MAKYLIRVRVEADNIRQVQAALRASRLGVDISATVRKITESSRADRLAEIASDIEGLSGDVESLRDELQEWLDGMPENLQQGSKAEELETAISELEEIMESLSQASDQCGVVSFPGMR